MRIAVFTGEYPSRPATFFGRDVRALVQAGLVPDVFPVRPLAAREWAHVPAWLNAVLPAERVHHVSPLGGLQPVRQLPAGRKPDIVGILDSAVHFGLRPLAKSAYAILHGLAVARNFGSRFDHILAYWGNYAATSAYVCSRSLRHSIPFSMFLHAGTDLYRDQVFLEQKLLAARNIFVVCDFNRRFIENKYPETYARIADRILVYHLGLDLNEFLPRSNLGEPGRLVCVGRLDSRKGFDDAVRALARLRAKICGVRLQLVGDGPERSRLAALASRLDVADLVVFSGWLSEDDTIAAIKRAAVLVHPSIGLGDAVPTVIKEAMALCTPVVASNVAGIPELLDSGRCGVLVPPRDPAALADAIEGLLSHRDRMSTMAAAAREFAERTFDTQRNSQVLVGRLSPTGAAATTARRAAQV